MLFKRRKQRKLQTSEEEKQKERFLFQESGFFSIGILFSFNPRRSLACGAHLRVRQSILPGLKKQATPSAFSYYNKAKKEWKREAFAANRCSHQHQTTLDSTVASRQQRPFLLYKCFW